MRTLLSSASSSSTSAGKLTAGLIFSYKAVKPRDRQTARLLASRVAKLEADEDASGEIIAAYQQLRMLGVAVESLANRKGNTALTIKGNPLNPLDSRLTRGTLRG